MCSPPGRCSQRSTAIARTTSPTISTPIPRRTRTGSPSSARRPILSRRKVWHAALQLLGYLVAINSFRDMAQILPRISKNDRSTLHYKLLRLGFYAGWAALFTVLGIWRARCSTGSCRSSRCSSCSSTYAASPSISAAWTMTRSSAARARSSHISGSVGSSRPHNINYHLEHHLFPGVPFYNLPKLHTR